MKDQKVELGDEVRDRVTGIEGIAVAHTKHMTGCDRITVQPPPGKDKDKIPDLISFDITMLEVVKKQKVKLPEEYERGERATAAKPGGPQRTAKIER